MAADLTSLIAASTTTDRLALLLTLLQLPNVPVTAWDSGSVGTGFLQVDATSQQDLAGLIAELAKSLYIDLADDPDWLNLATQSQYAEVANPAILTQGTIALEDPNNAGPFTIEAGQLYATDASGTLVYINQSAGTLAQGASLARSGTTVTGVGTAFVSMWQAETPGAAYNLPAGAIVSLATPLPGIVVSNPIISPATTWITQTGADQESMPARVARCKGKWPTLGPGAPAGAYVSLALAAAPGVITRALEVPGSPLNGLTVYIATAAGAPDAGTLATVQAYILMRKPQCVPLSIQAAAVLALEFSGTLTVVDTTAAATLAAVKTAIGAYLATIPIGGTFLASEMIRRIKSLANVLNITLGFGDFTLASNQVLGSSSVLYDSLTVVPVPAST